MTDTISTETKYKVLMEFLQSSEGAATIASSMVMPLQIRMRNYPFLTPRIYTEGVLPGGAPKTQAAFFSNPVSWADGSVDIVARVEQQMSQARGALVEQLDDPIFDLLRYAPARAWAAQTFLDTLTSFTSGDVRPLLVMDIPTYVKFRKVGPQWIDSEASQETTPQSGIIDHIQGCPVFLSEHPDDVESVFVVSRRPNQVMSPLEVGVQIATYDATAKSVIFGYAARMGTSASPDVQRFYVNSL